MTTGEETQRDHIVQRQSANSGEILLRNIQKMLAGKYMSFKLDFEEYGLEILKVKEIIGFMPITPVPKADAHIKGIINLRGKVIPVLDLRCKFGMSMTEPTDQTVIIVVQFNVHDKDFVMGIVVDQVLEVLNVEAEQIEPTPRFGSSNSDSEFILGVGKHADRIVFLLDIRRILNDDEIEVMHRVSLSPSPNQ